MPPPKGKIIFEQPLIEQNKFYLFNQITSMLCMWLPSYCKRSNCLRLISDPSGSVKILATFSSVAWQLNKCLEIFEIYIFLQ